MIISDSSYHHVSDNQKLAASSCITILASLILTIVLPHDQWKYWPTIVMELGTPSFYMRNFISSRFFACKDCCIDWLRRADQLSRVIIMEG